MKNNFKLLYNKNIIGFLFFLMLCIFLILTYFTFRVFSKDVNSEDMYIGSVMYLMKINGDNTFKINVLPGETEYDVEINLLVPVYSCYKLVYKNNENINIEYMSLPSGNINNIKKIRVRIFNNSLYKQEVEFDVIFSNVLEDKIEIPNGYKEITNVYKRNDLKKIVLYVDNENVDALDSNTYYDLERYECSNGEEAKWNNRDRSMTIVPFSKKTGCVLYLTKRDNPTLYEKILEDNEGGMNDEVIDFKYISSDTNGKGLYYTSNLNMTEDYDGDGKGDRVYYFRGAVTNNNVRFGGYCWKIIRINEDGSVRMIYNGEYSDGTCSVIGTNIGINNSSYKFHGSNDNEKYDEYVWSDGTGESNAKTQIETWYTSGGLSSYANDIVNVPYCADKSNPMIGYNDYTFYGAANRLTDINYVNSNYAPKGEVNPTFKCPNEYKYTVSGDNFGGNGKLSKPIGLISADEVIFAGGRFYESSGLSDNTTFYLYTSGYYWMMSPFRWNGSSASVFRIGVTGSLTNNYVTGSSTKLLPVISIRSNLLVDLLNEGTFTNPYVIQ